MYRFGPFEVDLDAGELRRDSVRLKLHDQPFRVLTLLVQRPGDVIPRDDLCRALWERDTFVDFDHGLNTAVNKLRQALGDSASHPRYVETVPRRGYRFVAPVISPGRRPARRMRWWVAAVVVLPLILIAVLVVSNSSPIRRGTGPVPDHYPSRLPDGR